MTYAMKLHERNPKNMQTINETPETILLYTVNYEGCQILFEDIFKRTKP